LGRRGKGEGRRVERREGEREEGAYGSDQCFTTPTFRLTARGKAELKAYVSEHAQAFYEAVRREGGREEGRDGGGAWASKILVCLLGKSKSGGRGRG